jgi:hypothetical protein
MTRIRRVGSLAIVLFLAAAIGACGDDDVPTPVRPSSAFGTDDPGTTAPPEPGDGGASSPPATGGNDAPGTGGEIVTGSRAKLEVSGDIRTSIELDRVQQPAILMEPPGGIGVGWSDADLGNLFTIAGVSFIGKRDTDPTTILTLSLTPKPTAGAVTFVSTSGECTITIDALSGAAARGTFICRDLSEQAGNRTIDVAGSFSVQTGS